MFILGAGDLHRLWSLFGGEVGEEETTDVHGSWDAPWDKNTSAGRRPDAPTPCAIGNKLAFFSGCMCAIVAESVKASQT
eukprot:1060969-Amphidinium_carterae.1